MVGSPRFASDVPEIGSPYAFARAVEVAMDEEHIELYVARFSVSSPDTHARILLLHGNPANLDTWRPLVPLLGKEHEIIAVDLPGFGKSSPILRRKGESRLDASARCVVALTDILGWNDPFFVVGHSHGGAVAQVMAAHYPERIAGIVLIATLGSPAHRTYRLLTFPGVASGLKITAALLRYSWFKPLFRYLLPGIMRPIFHPAPLSREEIEQQLLDFVERPKILVTMADVACGSPSSQLLHDAKEIRTPVLFLHGSEDHLVPVTNAKTLFAAIETASGNASFEVIPCAGHMLHITHASQVGHRITEWCRLVREGHSSSVNISGSSVITVSPGIDVNS